MFYVDEICGKFSVNELPNAVLAIPVSESIDRVAISLCAFWEFQIVRNSRLRVFETEQARTDYEVPLLLKIGLCFMIGAIHAIDQ
jgi:hypothetical protein